MRNKFRDRIADYYKTNRAIAEDSESNEEEQKGRPFTTQEKVMVVVAILLALLVLFKYVIL